MASNPYDRRTQPNEWQQWINDQVTTHDTAPGNETGHTRQWGNGRNED